MIFEKEYTNYWKKSVDKPIDGLKIAGLEEAFFFLKYLNIHNTDNVLDLGCSFGRMFEILNKYSNNIYGIDPEESAIEVAVSNKYNDVKLGNAENITFENSFFNQIFCWAVYDVVNHFNGLVEANRVLKNGGKILITGKLNNYFDDDINAFKAEKNAFLKSFPNHFLDLNTFIDKINNIGFQINKLFIFNKRGDFGSLKYKMISLDDLPLDLKGYEYLAVLQKQDIVNPLKLEPIKFDYKHSKTALRLAKLNNYENVEEYFNFLGID